jgi:hypothetical protein
MPKKASIGSLPATIDAKPSHLFRYGLRLEEMRVFFEAGVVLALYDALVLARDSGLRVPNWVAEGSSLSRAAPSVGMRRKFRWKR